MISINLCQQFWSNLENKNPKILLEKKNKIWLSPMPIGPIPAENSTTNWQHKNATKTSIADRLRTVSWSNNNNPIGVFIPLYRHPTFLLRICPFQNEQNRTNSFWTVYIPFKGQLFPYTYVVIRIRTAKVVISKGHTQIVFSLFTSFARLWRLYLTAYTICEGALFLWMFYCEADTTFK